MSAARVCVTTVLLTMLALASGCQSGYVLRGKVVAGPRSAVMVVPEDDPRLAGPGIDGATVELTMDPRSLGRKKLASSVAMGDGGFQIPINEFGAGVLEYELGAVVQQEGFQTAEGVFMLPPGGQQLLVILARGHDTYQAPEDPLKDLERYGN